MLVFSLFSAVACRHYPPILKNERANRECPRRRHAPHRQLDGHAQQTLVLRHTTARLSHCSFATGRSPQPCRRPAQQSGEASCVAARTENARASRHARRRPRRQRTARSRPAVRPPRQHLRTKSESQPRLPPAAADTSSPPIAGARAVRSGRPALEVFHRSRKTCGLRPAACGGCHDFLTPRTPRCHDNSVS